VQQMPTGDFPRHPCLEQSVPEHVTSAPSVAVFRSRLKAHLFQISYPAP